MPPAEALGHLGDDELRALRTRLLEAGYGEELVGEAERIAPRQLDAVRLPLVHSWLARRGGASSTLAVLFSYDGEASRTEARAALGDGLIEALVEAGVLVVDGDGALASRYRLTPLRGLWLLSDPPQAGPDTAMGPGPTTALLVDLVPEGAGDVLDVGCGAGTLALVAAARGARRAVGVDLSARAVALARFNARLNQLPAEFRAGDLLAPVRGERYDLVLSQPPYVPLPPGLPATTYLHGGALGDELALRFAASFPEVMAEGATALLHLDSPELPGRPLAPRLREALGPALVDVAVLTGAGPSADLEAAAYAVLEDPSLGTAYRAAARAYRDHLARLGVASFVRAVAVLRRTRAARGVVAQVPVRLDGLTAATLATFLRGLDLAGAGDEQLLAARVRLAPAARLVEELSLADPAARVRVTLRFEGGLATDQELTEASGVLAEALRSPGTVSEALESFARACQATPAEVQRQVLSAVRDGLARGAYQVEG